MSASALQDRVLIRRVPAAVGSSPAADAVDWQARWIVAFMAVGIAMRLIRYLLRFPLWGDESMLAVNFLGRDYAGLMRPLDCHQVAPLLFLWTELTAIKLLGFHEWSLRLFPLLCSIASIFLFHRLARHLLRGTALVLAIGIFAVNYSGIRYAGEVKPYGVDLMVSTIILLLTVKWWRRPDETRWLWMLTAAMPLALGVSFPAAFVAGGASVAIAAVLLSSRVRHGWAAWTAYNIVTAASFLTYYWLSIRAQAQAELGVMTVDWSDAFPPRDSFVKLVAWLLHAHVGPLLAVPVGGQNWGSAGTLLLCIAAAVVLVRQRRYRMLLLCAAPFALNLIAAALRRYPYGGHMRLTMHLVPIVSILAGIGAAAMLTWLSRGRGKARLLVGWASKPVRQRLDGLGTPSYQRDGLGGPSDQFNRGPAQVLSWPVAATIGLLMMLAVASTARDFCLPGKEQQDIRKRDFAAWFWGSMEREHEVACTMTELPSGIPFLEEAGRGIAAPQFLCNQQIYSPQHVQGQTCDMARVSPQRPLACVQYWDHTQPYDAVIFAHWLVAMQQRYILVGAARYPLLQDNDRDRQPEPADRVEVYEFAPKR